MHILKRIKIDLFGATVRYAVSAKQGDKGTRYIGVTLQQDGTDYLIPKDVEALVSIAKPDGYKIWNKCNHLGNEVLVPLTNQTLAAHGTALCDIELRTHEETLSSATFELEIYPTQRDERHIESTNEFTRLEIAIKQAQDALTTSMQALAYTQNVNAQISQEERLRVIAENLRVVAEAARETNTAEAIEACKNATTAAILQTEVCKEVTDATTAILMAQEGLNAAVAAVADYYNRIAELEKDMQLNLDGGSATSNETLLIKGGTARSVDRDKLIAGNAYTI